MTLPLRLKRNALSNFAGLMTLSLLPLIASILYVPLLGMDRFGVVGTASFLITLAASLDFGMARAVTQRFAQMPPDGMQDGGARSFARVAFWVYLLIVAVLAGAVAMGADYLTQYWLIIPPTLHAETQYALLIGGFTLVPHCLRVIPLAALNGLERQGVSNLLQTGTLAFRLAISLLVLEVIERSLTALMLTWLTASILESLVILWVTARCLKPLNRAPIGPTRWVILHDLARASRSDGTSALVGLATNFADKLILSRLLPIDLFGLYHLISLLGTSLNRLTAPIAFAAFPRWIAYQATGDRAALSSSYRAASQIAAALILPTMVAGLLFAPLVLAALFPSALIPPDLILAFRLIVLSGAANALGFMPYLAQLATGSTRVILRFALLSGALYLPLILLATPSLGLFLPIGARLVLESVSLALFAIVLHRRILPGDGGRWLRESLLAPLSGLALPVAVGAFWLADAPPTLMSFAKACGVGSVGILGALIATPAGRRQINALFRRLPVFPRGRG